MTGWDVIIIGGGLAGAASAIRLARAGRRVLVLEKEPGPHHKVCGEFISTEAQHYLEKLGLTLTALGAQPINHVAIVHGSKTARTPLPFAALSLSRYVLDEQLLQAAIKNGAEVRRGVNVAGLELKQGGMTIRLAGAENETLFAPTVFLATGKHDLRGWQRPPAIQNNFVGLKMHFYPDAPKPDNKRDVTIILFDGGYAGMETIENNLVNLCLVISKHRLTSFGHSWEKLLNDLMTQAPMLSETLAGADPCWDKPLAIYGIPYGFVYRDKSPTPGVYRLGDQMGVIPSFFGNGISIALHTAFHATENYLHAGERQYHRQMAAELYPKLYPAAMLSRLMVAPLMQPLLFRICRTFPQLVKAAATHTRLRIMP